MRLMVESMDESIKDLWANSLNAGADLFICGMLVSGPGLRHADTRPFFARHGTCPDTRAKFQQRAGAPSPAGTGNCSVSKGKYFCLGTRTSQVYIHAR